MKTIEQVKEYFKNAKEVRSVWDYVFEIKIDSIEYDDVSDAFFSYDNTGELKCVYHKERGFAEIISYKEDTIVESVINQFKERSKVGIEKYGTTLDRNDLNTLEWIEHAKQEAMDFILYLEKLKREYDK